MRALVRRLAATRLGSAALARLLPPLDRVVHRLTGGRWTAAGLLAGIPVALLSTTGRRSGSVRTVPLLAVPLPQGWGVVASAFGNERHPAWYLNLRSEPRAVLEVSGRRYAVCARDLVGAEREELRRLAVGIYPGFAAYERRVGARMIPFVLLERDRAGTPRRSAPGRPLGSREPHRAPVPDGDHP